MTAIKIAVLLNGFASPNTPAIRESYITAVSAASEANGSPTPSVDFYDPIVAQIHPDPSLYDLIVLGGGTADPMGSDAWVLKLQKYLQTTVADHPKQKIVGICWGHQTISISFGAKVGNMEGAEIGVTEITLTPEGKKMFPFAPDGKLQMHEFHRREIKTPAKGFVPLAEGSQSFVNEANTIMTFQGHPELSEKMGKIMLADTPSYMGLEGDKREICERSMEKEHDGVKIWGRILQWVEE